MLDTESIDLSDGEVIMCNNCKHTADLWEFIVSPFGKNQNLFPPSCMMAGYDVVYYEIESCIKNDLIGSFSSRSSDSFPKLRCPNCGRWAVFIEFSFVTELGKDFDTKFETVGFPKRMSLSVRFNMSNKKYLKGWRLQCE